MTLQQPASFSGVIHEAAAAEFHYNPRFREVITPFLGLFHINFAKQHYVGTSVSYVCFLHPCEYIRNNFGFEREVLCVYVEYPTLLPRTFQMIGDYLDQPPAIGRVEPLIYFLITPATNREAALSDYFIDATQTRLPVVFTADACLRATDSKFIIEQLRKSLFSRDLYDVEEPIQDDVYFFGRKGIVFEYLDSIKRGQNLGLFGLRKMGKTSVLFKLQRMLIDQKLGHFVYFNLENPKYYATRWWDLLGEIRNRLPGVSRARTTWDSDTAVKAFERAAKEYRKSWSESRLVIALDEVEHIAPKLSTRAHWDRDFLDFWKAMRAIQSQHRFLSVIVAGVNASVIETPVFGDVDNPLFSWAKSRYVPPFNAQEVGQMVRTLGRYVGLRWSDDAIVYLAERYGGHPLLTRLACSHLHRAAPSIEERPTLVDAAELSRDEDARDSAMFEFAQHVLGMLQRWYPEEFRLLQSLASDGAYFREMRKQRPDLVRHLISYGLIEVMPIPRIRLPFLLAFLNSDIGKAEYQPHDSYSVTDFDDTNWTTLGQLRNRLEPKMRRLIKRTFLAHYGLERWVDPVLLAIPEDRRKKLQGVDRDEILNRRMFFLDLINTISANWKYFSHLSSGLPENALDKTHFEILAKYVNTRRHDAHAKEVGTPEVVAVDLAVRSIEASIDRFLID